MSSLPGTANTFALRVHWIDENFGPPSSEFLGLSIFTNSSQNDPRFSPEPTANKWYTWSIWKWFSRRSVRMSHDISTFFHKRWLSHRSQVRMLTGSSSRVFRKIQTEESWQTPLYHPIILYRLYPQTPAKDLHFSGIPQNLERPQGYVIFLGRRDCFKHQNHP